MELLSNAATNVLTTSEIARETGASRATTHAVLAELTHRGWVVRHPATGAFGVGPMFIALGRAAARTDVVSHWGGVAIHRLADVYGVPCFLARRISRFTLTVADTAVPSRFAPAGDDEYFNSDELPVTHPWMRVAGQIRLRPPICREFVAWSPADERAQWLGAAPAERRDRLEDVLTEVRSRGYSIERMTADHLAVLDALSNLESIPRYLRDRLGEMMNSLEEVDYLPGELPDMVSAVTIGAPIFDGDDVVASIVASPRQRLTTSELDLLGRAVRDAADSVTSQVG